MRFNKEESGSEVSGILKTVWRWIMGTLEPLVGKMGKSKKVEDKET